MKKFLIFTLVVVLAWSAYKGASSFLNNPTPSTDKPETVNLPEEPTQLMLAKPKLIFQRSDGFRASAIAEYKIEGVVLGKSVNQKFGGNSIYPIDIGLIFGEPAMTDYKAYIGNYYTGAAMTDTNRTIWIDFKKDPPNGWTQDYVMNHIANNHISPANENIYNAVKSLKEGVRVLMKGYLLRTDWNGSNVKDSSLSRTDRECEDFYVDEIQIGNKIYK